MRQSPNDSQNDGTDELRTVSVLARVCHGECASTSVTQFARGCLRQVRVYTVLGNVQVLISKFFTVD